MRALLALLALLPALAWGQAAGRVLMAVGEVSVLRGNATLPLALNSQVFPGDTIRLGVSSNAQIRLSDESIIGLRERSVFRIDEYQYAQGEGKSVFSLLAGGMRTVTGQIGRLAQQRGNYAVRTPTSTIGIRGTHFTLVHCNNDCGNVKTASALLASASLTASDAGPLAQAPGGAGGGVANGTYGGVTDGRISAAPNEAPQFLREFGHDEYFHVASANSQPQSLIAPPSFLHDRLTGQNRTTGQQGNESGDNLAQGGINAESRPGSVPEGPRPSDFIVTEQKTSTGSSTVVSSVPTHGGLVSFRAGDGSHAAGGAFISPSMVSISGSGGSRAVTSFNIPTGTTTTDDPIAAPGFTATSSGPISDIFVGSSVEILMGRWTGGNAVDDTGTSHLLGGLHFIYGPLTPPEAIAAKSGSFLFSSVASTTPTHSGGLTFGGGGFSNSLVVNFTNRTVNVPASSFNFGAQTWNLPGTTANITIVSGVGASFGTGNLTGGSCVGAGCAGTVKMEAGGIFMGPATSQHLGVTFGATNNTFQTIQGAKVYFCSGC